MKNLNQVCFIFLFILFLFYFYLFIYFVIIIIFHDYFSFIDKSALLFKDGGEGYFFMSRVLTYSYTVDAPVSGHPREAEKVSAVAAYGNV